MSGLSVAAPQWRCCETSCFRRRRLGPHRLHALGRSGVLAGTRWVRASPVIPRTSRRGSMASAWWTSRTPSAACRRAGRLRSRCMAAITTTPVRCASATSVPCGSTRVSCPSCCRPMHAPGQAPGTCRQRLKGREVELYLRYFSLQNPGRFPILGDHATKELGSLWQKEVWTKTVSSRSLGVVSALSVRRPADLNQNFTRAGVSPEDGDIRRGHHPNRGGDATGRAGPSPPLRPGRRGDRAS